MRVFSALTLASLVCAAPRPESAEVNAVAVNNDVSLLFPLVLTRNGTVNGTTLAEAAFPLADAVNNFLQTALDPFGLIAAARQAGRGTSAAASAAAAAAFGGDATAAAAAGGPAVLEQAYSTLAEIESVQAAILAAPFTVATKLIGGLLRLQGGLLRNLGGLLTKTGRDADALPDLVLGGLFDGTGIPAAPFPPFPRPLLTPLAFPRLPKLATPKGLGAPLLPFPAFAPLAQGFPVPQGLPAPGLLGFFGSVLNAQTQAFQGFAASLSNSTGGLPSLRPKGAKGRKTPKGLGFPKLPTLPLSLAPAGFARNGTIRGRPLPKGGLLGFLGAALESDAKLLSGMYPAPRNSTLRGRPRLSKGIKAPKAVSILGF